MSPSLTPRAADHRTAALRLLPTATLGWLLGGGALAPKLPSRDPEPGCGPTLGAMGLQRMSERVRVLVSGGARIVTP